MIGIVGRDGIERECQARVISDAAVFCRKSWVQFLVSGSDGFSVTLFCLVRDNAVPPRAHMMVLVLFFHLTMSPELGDTLC